MDYAEKILKQERLGVLKSIVELTKEKIRISKLILEARRKQLSLIKAEKALTR